MYEIHVKYLRESASPIPVTDLFVREVGRKVSLRRVVSNEKLLENLSQNDTQCTYGSIERTNKSRASERVGRSSFTNINRENLFGKIYLRNILLAAVFFRSRSSIDRP